MQNLKRAASIFIAVIAALSLSVPAFAAEGDSGFSDVDADSWYADAALYCRDNGLMSGTSDTTFSPDTPMTRAMLCLLYTSPFRTDASSFSPPAPFLWESILSPPNRIFNKPYSCLLYTSRCV